MVHIYITLFIHQACIIHIIQHVSFSCRCSISCMQTLHIGSRIHPIRSLLFIILYFIGDIVLRQFTDSALHITCCIEYPTIDNSRVASGEIFFEQVREFGFREFFLGTIFRFRVSFGTKKFFFQKNIFENLYNPIGTAKSDV